MAETGPTTRQVHIDGPLTNISVAYINEGYIADLVFPNVPVVKISDLYWIYTKSDWFRNSVALRAPGTRAQRADYGVSTSNYLCNTYAIAKGVPDETVRNADSPLQPLAEATQWCTEQVMLNKEIKVSEIAFGDSQWSSSATPGTLWDVDTSDPIGDVSLGANTVRQAIGRFPNVGVIGGGLWRHLKKHPDLINRVVGAAGPTSPALLSRAAIGALFELDNILVGNAVQETGPEGGTSTRSDIWGLHMTILYRTPTPGLRVPNAGYVFTWFGREVNRYREDQEHQDVVEVSEAFDTKLVASDAGYHIRSAATA